MAKTFVVADTNEEAVNRGPPGEAPVLCSPTPMLAILFGSVKEPEVGRSQWELEDRKFTPLARVAISSGEKSSRRMEIDLGWN